jgi:hypothetical protein
MVKTGMAKLVIAAAVIGMPNTKDQATDGAHNQNQPTKSK